MKKRHFNLVAYAGAVLGLSFAAIPQADAQSRYYGGNGYNSYGYNSYNNRGGYNQYDLLGRNVYSLHQYGTQMTNYYTNEHRGHNGCRKSRALLDEMRRYNGYTSNLYNAYRGNCPKTFKKWAYASRDSLSRIQRLQRHAQVSPYVSGFITRSCPMATYVRTNYTHFRPYNQPSRTPVPVYGHHHYKNDDDGGFDFGSALIGAIVGRIIHGAVQH